MSCFALLALGMIISTHTYVTIWQYLPTYPNTMNHTFFNRLVISGVSLYAIIRKGIEGAYLVKCILRVTIVTLSVTTFSIISLRAERYPVLEF